MPENADDPASFAANDPASFRAALRKKQLTERSALPAEQRQRHSQAICQHLWHWFARLGAAEPGKRRFGFCLPFRDECDVLPLAQYLSGNGWHACVPVVENPDAPMVFRDWSPLAPMTHDRHGIAIPDTSHCEAPEILLLPLVAVDPAGYRLGYGGGYFDRTLDALAHGDMLPLCVGVGFAQAQVPNICAQAHDRRVDGLASEIGLSSFTNNFARTLDVAG